MNATVLAVAAATLAAVTAYAGGWATVTVKTMTETITAERDSIEGIQESSLSLMPEGLLEGLSPDDTRDLVAYLMYKVQVPLPADPK